MEIFNMKASWESGDPYEYFMGRWSSLVARSFVDWLSPSFRLKWLDIGCGSGALSESIIHGCKPAELIAVDQSEGFLKVAQKRLGSRVNFKIGDALALPLDDSSVNFTVSGLVLNFISEPQKAIAEMKRVTSPEGTVAAYIWDYGGRMEFLKYFWDAVVELDPEASSLHEGNRFPDSTEDNLKELFVNAGIEGIKTGRIEIDTHFRDFDDYWKPFLGGQGPAPTYVLSLAESDRNKLQDILLQRLPIRADGSIPMRARAWAAKGKVQ
ncbi:MAG: class I SAM-dependent methyltransferase [candidate division Zixibacteria bacterium]|nr:class I SAM-dependent methyltransferase [candidate division Zixibacteria bacterium]